MNGRLKPTARWVRNVYRFTVTFRSKYILYAYGRFLISFPIKVSIRRVHHTRLVSRKNSMVIVQRSLVYEGVSEYRKGVNDENVDEEATLHGKRSK